MKKICMVIQNPTVKGGIATVVNGYKGSQLEKDYTIIYVESYMDGGKTQKIIKGICGYFHFLKVLLKDNPDIIHIHSSFGASFYRKIFFIYVSSLFKKPVINHIHGSEFGLFYTNASKTKKRFIKRVWNKCSVFIVLSEKWKEIFSDVIPKEKMVVIENYSKNIKEGDRTQCHNRILFLGSINKMKGCYDIVDVVTKIKEKNTEIKMIIAGTGDIGNIKKASLERNIQNNISFPGWLDEIERDHYLKMSDIFFLPSYTEGMPMSILEAMGYGLPVVSTNIGGIPDLVKNNENGYLSDPGNTDEMAENILSILNNEKKRIQMGKKSLEIVREKYSLDKHIEKLKAIYNALGQSSQLMK